MAKPTPTKLVLLMSAAGLGLSWSGLALASRDDAAASSPSFGAAPRQEQDCAAADAERWMSCPAAQGELVRTLVAASERLPVTLAAVAARGEGTLTLLVPQAAAVADAPLVAQPGDVPSEADTAAPAEGDTAGGGAAQPASAVRVEISEIQPTDAAALDRVLASLVDVLGAQLDASPEEVKAASGSAPKSEVAAVQAAQAEPMAAADTAVLGPAEAEAPAAAAPVLAAQPGEPTAAPSLQPAQQVETALAPQPIAEIDEVQVAASHSDKVLMSLAALRSADLPEAGGVVGANKKVVLRQTDKVLETLASLRYASDKRAAYSCTRTAPRAAGHAVRAAEPQYSAADAALASLGLQLDIDLDLLGSPTQASGEPIDLTPLAQAARQAVPAQATETEHRAALGNELVALGSNKLDEVRGGFVTPEGMKISFGIERAVYLNGTLVTTTSLNIADLSKIAGGQAQVSGNGLGSLGLLQSGLGNVFAPGSISSTAAGTIIQNTLDNQKIQTITRIDAAVNSTGILRAINLQSSMQGAIVNSLRR